MRKTIIVIACCIVALLLGYTGYRGYQVWRQKHWMTLAKDFAAKNDIANELLSLQQALRLDPQNIEACRMMAKLAEAVNDPMALNFRRKIVDLDPQSLDDRLALAQTAMFFKDFQTATNTLARASEADQKTVAYQNISGIVAAALGQVDKAQKYFNEALRLDPNNPTPQINLAVMQLHSTNSLDQAEGRIRLQRIDNTTTNTLIQAQVRHELVVDAMRHQDYATALSVSKELAEMPKAKYSDRLLRLDVLKDAKSPAFKSTLNDYQHEAAGNALEIPALADWMMKKASLSDTLSWLRGLQPQIQTNAPVTLLIADCLMGNQDWHGLQAAIQNQDWNNLEYARHAYLARALRGQSLNSAADAEWSSALQYAGDPKRSTDWQKQARIWLFTHAVKWNWADDRDELLWTFVNTYPDLKWAPALLKPTLIASGRTRPLMQLLGIMNKRNPDDLGVKNDLALTAMLLGANEINPFGMAREIYLKDSKNPAYVSTYAFSLYLQKKYDDALKVMQQLPPQQLSLPAVAGYYGLVLNATGNAQAAREHFAIAAKATLLPEEKRLFHLPGQN